jgi:tetratricopeptide (TPR) repeat protein
MPSPTSGEAALPDSTVNTTAPAPPVLTPGLTSSAQKLLIGASVYREPADRNAILFQLGRHDWAAARAPDQAGPTPPYQPPADLPEVLASCVTAGLLTADAADSRAARSWHVDPAVAVRLHAELAEAGRDAELVIAHRRAARYWRWRAAAWPQDRESDLHDLLEARHHLFSAGDAEQASDLTREVCAQLHAWGELTRESELIQSTLELLPGRATGHAAGWLHELGAISQVRGDLEEAQRCYAASVELFAIVGDYRGVARGQHSLGVLAQAQGDYRRAERHYRRSSAAEKKAGAIPDAADAGSAVDASAAEAASAAATATAARRRGKAGPRRQAPRRGLRPGAEPGQVSSAGPQPGQPSAAQPAPDRGRAAEPDPRPQGTARPAPDLVVRAAVGGGSALLPAPGRSRANGTAPGAATMTASPEPIGTELRPAARQPSQARRPVLILAVVGWVLVALTVAGIGAALARSAPASSTPPGSATRLRAASWVAAQVSRSAVVACDPAMCAALQRDGVPAGELLTLGTDGPADLLGSDVVVATAAVRSEFGIRLASVYAPVILASFGSGTTAIQVRAIAPDGAPAYARALRADLAARQRLGMDLLHNPDLIVSAPARAQLAAGDVDTRLLATLATLADMQRLRVIAFADAGPGAAPIVPLRSAEVAAAAPSGPVWIHSAVAFLSAQQPPFRPSSARPARAPGYPHALLISFPCPSPLGLLATTPQS